MRVLAHLFLIIADCKYWFIREKNTNLSLYILVQLESFQASVIDKAINGEEVTPNLNRLKKESLYFSSFYHQTHKGRTSDAEFITNTSF